MLVLVFSVPSMIEVFTLWSKDMGTLHATPPLLLGIILFGHASMDRVFGYGLKFGDNFHHTHLGWIGKLKAQEQAQQAIALAPAPAPELLQHRDELAPRPHGFAVLLAHHPADLVDMRQVVRGPCGDELMQPHFAEGGMDADAIQLRGGEV